MQTFICLSPETSAFLHFLHSIWIQVIPITFESETESRWLPAHAGPAGGSCTAQCYSGLQCPNWSWCEPKIVRGMEQIHRTHGSEWEVRGKNHVVCVLIAHSDICMETEEQLTWYDMERPTFNTMTQLFFFMSFGMCINTVRSNQDVYSPRPPGRDLTTGFSWAMSRASHNISSVAFISGSRLNLHTNTQNRHKINICSSTWSEPFYYLSQTQPSYSMIYNERRRAEVEKVSKSWYLE